MKLRAFSIIIPTKNRATSIVSLIRQLLSQQYPKRLYEIIVINNNSIDDTKSQLQTLASHATQLRVYNSALPGPSYTRNLGYKKAKFSHVIFLDDDICVQKNFLAAYARAWDQHPKAAVIGGRIDPDPTLVEDPSTRSYRTTLIRKYDWVYACIVYGQTSYPLVVNNLVCSAMMSVNKRAIAKRQPFDTRFGSTHLGLLLLAEDYEFITRLLLENKRVWYIPFVHATHKFSEERFNKSYITKRHVLAGIETFLMDRKLKTHYPRYATETVPMSLWFTLKAAAHGKLSRFIHLYADPMMIIFLFSYCIFGPIIAFADRKTFSYR